MRESDLDIVIIISVIIFLISFSTFLVFYELRKRKKFSKNAVNYIRTNFPYLTILHAKGNIFQTPEVRAETTEPFAPLQNLQIIKKIENVAGSSVTRIIVKAKLNMPEAYELENFIIEIFRTGFLIKVVSKNNVVLGINEVDDNLLIRSDSPTEAKSILLSYAEFLQSLSTKRDLKSCKIQTSQNQAEIELIFGKTNIKSLVIILELIKILVENVAKRQKEKPIQPIQEQKSSSTSVKEITFVSEEYTKEENILQEIQLAFDNEIVTELKKDTSKFESLEIKDSSANFSLKDCFFKRVECKWTKDTLNFKASNISSGKRNLEINISHKNTQQTSNFNWSVPCENLSIFVNPEKFQQEIRKSYDILWSIQGLNHQKILSQVKFLINENQISLNIETEKTLNNIEKCFELIESKSWKLFSEMK